MATHRLAILSSCSMPITIFLEGCRAGIFFIINVYSFAMRRVHWTVHNNCPRAVRGDQREERPREEMPRDIWNWGEGVLLGTKQASQHSIFCTAITRSTEYTVLAGCSVHNGPPSPKFQILPSQLRQTADRAAGLHMYKESLGETRKKK